MRDKINTILNYADPSISQENANLNGKTTSAKQTLIAGSALKDFAMPMLDDDVRKAFECGEIHIHDFDHYGLGTTTCTQIELSEVLDGGFVTNGSTVRQAQGITVAMAHAAIAMQANQNQQHGGQAFPNWDFDLAPYVEMSYTKHMNFLLEMNYEGDIEKMAMKLTEQEVDQAAEAFVHNMNTMNGSRGGQSVFSSINFGLDTSWQGRMVTRSTLKAMINGLGDGQTAIYPICIFKLKRGVSFDKHDPNYDLFRLSIFATSKRLFPNYQFCDSTFNKQPEGTDPRKEIATMGCRTRTFENLHGETSPVGRGNASFTTINLPMLAAKNDFNTDMFFRSVDDYVDLVVRQLIKRYEFQRRQQKDTFDFVYSQGSFSFSDDRDDLFDLMKHNTLAVGFVGLAEAQYLLELTDDERWDVVERMKRRCDMWAKHHQLNISLLATPAEGLAEKAHANYVRKYGEIEGLETHEFFTNSFHVPVWQEISAADKIRFEAPYHKLCLGGHISYVEISAEDATNYDKIESLIRLMESEDMGYASINVPVDRCINCGHDEPIEGDNCPACGSPNISRVRRITGYLVGDMSKWNKGKFDEERRRVKHEL